MGLNKEENNYIEECIKTNITEIRTFDDMVYISTDINIIICFDWGTLIQQNNTGMDDSLIIDFTVFMNGEGRQSGFELHYQSPLIYSYQVSLIF